MTDIADSQRHTRNESTPIRDQVERMSKAELVDLVLDMHVNAARAATPRRPRRDEPPARCPFCDAAQRDVRYVPTLGNEVTYWCGRKLNDNGGSWSRDWTTCNA
jgi:hypothetical protein